VETVMKDHGADVARWWTSSIDYENDIRMDIEFFNVAGEAYRKVRNTIRYLLSNLEDFDHATHGIAPSAHRSDSLEAWMLAELSRVQREVRASYKAFRFRDANRAIFDFCNDTLSAGYCVATKDRLYCDAADSPRRRAAQSAMYTAAATLCRMLAPLLPHTADEAWRVLKRDDAACIMLEQYEALDVTADSRWEAVWALEDAVGKALEAAKSNGIDNKLDAGLVLPDPTNQLHPFMGDLADLFGVSRVALAADGAVQVEDLREQPRCERSWRRDVSVRLRSDGGMLSDRDAQAIGV
jgi:isoleucyl-tRNA synthetase